MPKVSEAHRAARQRQIIDAARRCFARDGFHQASMLDIVQESGLSAGAIYGHFKSKEEIVEAIARERHRRERELLGAAHASEDGLGALRALARRFLESLERPEELQERRLGVQVWAEALRSPALLRQVREGVEQPQAALAEILRQARERGELPPSVDAAAAARLMIAVFHGILLQKAWNPRLSIEPLLETIELILRGLEGYGRGAEAATPVAGRRRRGRGGAGASRPRA
jgi:AcrR family transcriptional regulator